jgi:FAD/FMN-containing dehydrogenase/SAM-dependent methyltransferase
MLINDITGLNPIMVDTTIVPKTVAEVQAAVTDWPGSISVGGGLYSMGGQIATEGSLHIDMRELKAIIDFNPLARRIQVQAGISWCEIQELIDPHDLSIKIMQSYANFTVGGALSVNAHGCYMGLGPVIMSVLAIALVLADGSLIEASPSQNSELFFAAIGGYGGIGIIVQATLKLVPNVKVECRQLKLATADYPHYFMTQVRNNTQAVFHNADLYPFSYQKARAVTWQQTEQAVTIQQRLIKPKSYYLLHNYFIWSVSETPLGKWCRQYIIDPLLYARKLVVWRNYEASHDVIELGPLSRAKATYVLQEYFIPIAQFSAFVTVMADILQRYQVNVLKVSVCHANKDPGSLLAWAREEVFSFVLYYQQKVHEIEVNKVAIWTRELIEATLAQGGSYYLPYQLWASNEQFHRAYPKANEFFRLKDRLDPNYKFRNKLWDKYYLASAATLIRQPSLFRRVFSDTFWRDQFYLFLQNIYRIYPEDAFHWLIWQLSEQQQSDQAIYESIQQQLVTIKPKFAELRYALSALAKQKREMLKQTLTLLGQRRTIKGYLEIGSASRYLKPLAKALDLTGPVYLLDEKAPGYSPVDMAERGGMTKRGKFTIPTASLDLVTCYIGLHHVPREKLAEFINSIWRVLRPGGIFIIRDHDVSNKAMFDFVSLTHTVFNAGLNVPWSSNQAELRHFTSIEALCDELMARGFSYTGHKLLQAQDPSYNYLLSFIKTS